MAKYENLKDYLRLNNMSVISQGLNDYIKSNSNGDNRYQANDIIIHTLAWNSFDCEFLTVTIGVSAKLTTTIDSTSSLHYYNMTVQGQFLKGLSDLSLSNIEEVPESLLQKETILSLLGMENITSDNIEEKAEELYSQLCSDIHINKEHKYWLPVIDIKEKYGMKLWPADLPDNCFGRLYLLPSTATIYDPANIYKPYSDEPIPRGAILLNRRYYINEIDPDDIITTAHELSHWSCHQLYFFIMMLLEDGFDAMSCTTDPIILDDKMTSKEKAYFYAEWQANELSIRVAIPKHLVEEAVSDYEKSHSNIPHEGFYYQNMIYKLSWDFNVPKEIMKKRFRQLGYDYADGTFLTVDDCLYQPFSFASGTLKENETFVINRASYKKLLRDDKKFAELIRSKKFVYTGYVVCIYSGKFIKPVREKGEIRYTLSEYGRNNVNKCCLIFERNPETPVNRKNVFYVNEYFCRLNNPDEYVEEDKDGEYILSEDANEDKKTFFYERYEVINDMKAKQINTLHDALIYHKERKKLTYDQLSHRCSMCRETIDAYFAKPSSTKFRKCPIEKLMVICNGLELEETPALDLLKKAGYALNEDVIEGQMYRYLLTITNASLEAWNQILSDAGLKPLS